MSGAYLYSRVMVDSVTRRWYDECFDKPVSLFVFIRSEFVMKPQQEGES